MDISGFRSAFACGLRRLAAPLVVALLAATAAAAHEGHDHGPPAAPAAASSPRAAAVSDQYELVAILRGDRLTIYLDRFADNEPVTDATVAVTIADAADAVTAERTGEGTYQLTSERLRTPGEVELVFAITRPDGDDLLATALRVPDGPRAEAAPVSALHRWFDALSPATLGVAAAVVLGVPGLLLLRRRNLRRAAAAGAAALGLIVLVGDARAHEGHDHGPTTAAPQGDSPRRLPDGSVFVPKPTQRLLELRTRQVRSQEVQPSVALIGRVIADPNRTSLAQSIHGGRVIAPEAGLPRIGQTVAKGDLLARIEPFLPQADRTTIAEKMGEVEQLIAVAETKLRRVRELAERNVAPQSQVADATVELDGLRRRREVLREFQTAPEVLRAATSGVIASARALPGQVVQAQDVLFQIVDPASLWVEALVFGETDPGALADATATTSGGDQLKLRMQGFSRALQQQAVVVQFAIDGAPPNLNVGLPVNVYAKTGTPRSALVLPREALVRSANGETVVWRHVDAERFEPRPVRSLPLDSANVIVAAGIAEGDRVVTRAADLVNQIR